MLRNICIVVFLVLCGAAGGLFYLADRNPDLQKASLRGKMEFQARLIVAEYAMRADMQNRIGEAYLHGHIVDKSPDRAMRWLYRAAGHGHADAQYNLGAMYFSGAGIERDRGEAESWWTAAAKQEHAGASARLGEWYLHTARGDKAAYEKAFPLLRRAARAGNPASQMQLGVMYAGGVTGKVRIDAAIRWMMRSTHKDARAMNRELLAFRAELKTLPEDIHDLRKKTFGKRFLQAYLAKHGG